MMKKYKFKKRKKNSSNKLISFLRNNVLNISIFICIIIIVLLIIKIFNVPNSFAYLLTSRQASGKIEVAKFDFNVGANSVDNFNQTINLKDTVDINSDYTTNKVVPGRTGHFVLVMNATNSDVAIKYSVSFLRSALPVNLKFYSDSSYQHEITNVSGKFYVDGFKTKQIDVYWKWELKNDNASNINDNLFQDKEVSFLANVIAEQLVEEGDSD